MAGYTTIEIGGQQVGLRFGLAALKIAVQKNAMKAVGETFETPDSVSTARYLHAAYADNCYAKEINIEFGLEPFMDWVEHQMMHDKTEMQRVMEVIATANYVKPKEEHEDKKKVKRKLTGTK